MEAQQHDGRARRKRKINTVPPEQRDATDVNTTADLLGISRRKVYRLIAAGALGSIKIGGRRLVPRVAREQLIAKLLAEASAP